MVDFFDAKVVCLNGFSTIQEFCTFQLFVFPNPMYPGTSYVEAITECFSIKVESTQFRNMFQAQSLILLDMIYRIKYTNSGCEMFNRGNKGNMNIADSPGGIFALVSEFLTI